MRRNFFALEAEATSPPSFFIKMPKKTLSIFVDESGRFQHPDDASRFYILSLVLHDQNMDIMPLVREFDDGIEKLGLSNFCFHAGPIIRQEKGYSFLNRELRGKIFFKMLTFAKKAPINYHCLSVDKKFITSTEQLVTRLEEQLSAYLESQKTYFSLFDVIKIYYDCGQSPVTNILHRTFNNRDLSIVFAQNVSPKSYKLFQIADLACTIKLIELKLENNIGMTASENTFFGGPRSFKRNVLRQIKLKEI